MSLIAYTVEKGISRQKIEIFLQIFRISLIFTKKCDTFKIVFVIFHFDECLELNFTQILRYKVDFFE